MTTYAGTSVAGTSGVSSTSSINQQSINASNTGTGGNAGVAIYATSTAQDAIHGASSSSVNSGVWGSNTNGGYGVAGSTGGGAAGVYGSNTGNGSGVYGTCSGQFGIGTVGICDASFGIGVYGEGTASNGYAGYFSGVITKSSGSFLIDHPLDPAKKYLEHSFVESPDMKNIYDGVAVAGASGEIAVQLPPYFDALNESFRYQLTAIGQAAPNLHVKQELVAGTFVIAGANAGQKVSWQVTGVRKDPWAKAHPIVAERDKPAQELGLYKHPEVYGLPAAQGIGWNRVKKGTPGPSTLTTPRP
jgi:hypothetical protein